MLKYNGCFENCAKDRIDTRIGSLGLSRINEREGTKMYTFSTVAICQNCKRITTHLFGVTQIVIYSTTVSVAEPPLVVNLTPYMQGGRCHGKHPQLKKKFNLTPSLLGCSDLVLFSILPYGRLS